MNSRFFILVATLCGFLLGPLAHAQYEIRGGATNLLDSRRAGASAAVTSGAVSAITVRGGGAGYTSAPTVTVGPPPSGTTATATAVLTGGVVTSITINTGGSGYSAVPPTITIAPPALATGTAATTPQYAGQANTSSTAGPISTSGITAGRYPRASDKTVVAAPVVTMVLARASMGHSFASGVPRYMMGEEIQRPAVTWSGALTANTYWRAQPVQPGETFSSAYVTNLNGASQPLSPMGTVNVTSSSTTSATVTVASVPSGLASGAMLMGQRVNVVDGLTVTLAGTADSTISASTAKTFTPVSSYYFSPHANKVFATQPGRVTITWVSAVPDTSASGESVATYKFRTEVFSVSSASQRTPRTIYWTQKSFSSPLVQIPTGRIVTVNPVYNIYVPSHVADEFTPVGYTPPTDASSQPSSEKRTLWFDKASGQAALKAYNTEGRIFVEYLGNLQQGSSGVHEFLGADIVDVKMVAESTTIETPLGQQLRPRQEAAQDGDDQLIPSVVFNSNDASKPLYGTSALANGALVYHAERENNNPDKIVVYWLEEKDASIYFLTAPNAPDLAIRWPKYLRKYTQVWPSAIADYETVTVTDSGSGVSTGPVFEAAHLPEVVFQDDPAESETSLDILTQHLLVDFSSSADKTNRTLLKFAGAGAPWYVPLYIQSENKLGSAAVADPDGAGPLNGVAAVSTINDLNADGVADLLATVNVGQRLTPPSSAYSVAGYITSGSNYYPAGYINPFTNGVKAAEAGAIIPVNALPGQNQLTVWWFKQVVAPNSQFASFYLPSVVGRYTVVYPTSPAPPEIVIASGMGTGDLGPSQQLGSLYVQNDSTQIGFNPNEEHALMVAGRAYALRDDLNNATTTSSPFVLLAYTNPTDLRPSIDAYKVVRSNFTYPLTYNAIAGTKAQPPMPLAALPPALDSSGNVLNYEITGTADNATGANAPTAYNSFTFRDRQGYDWTYRGAHAKTSAAATTVIDGGGGVSSITVSVKGAGYTTAPVVSVAPPNSGTTATATATLGGLSAASFTITSGTKTYSVAPTVAITGGGGSGATATAVLSNGLVTGINLTAAGTGYTTTPTIAFSGGTQLVAGTAPTGLGNTTGFAVTSIAVTNAGTGYSTAPLVSIAPPVSFGMRYYYNSRDGFYLPSLSLAQQPTAGTIMPFIADTGSGVPVTLTYAPKWPDDATLPIAQQKIVPVLEKAETLTLAKASAIAGALPQVRGATSAQVYYQQSIANTGSDKNSVTLHDATRAKTFLLGNSGELQSLPSTVLTSDYAGKTYFQKLPPHLQQRFYFDGNNGSKGALTFKGEFVDEIAGEDYLNLNVLGTADLAELKNLCPATDTGNKSKWDAAIDGLSTQIETFSENSAVPGTYIVDSAKDHRKINKDSLADITDPDTAVDSYALSATGKGTGYVTLVFENGEAFTDSGTPIAMQIIKVDPALHTGDLKVLLSSNPLDEQVTLRHSGDYAGHPELYEFQWRYGFPTNGSNPPLNGTAATATATLGLSAASFTLTPGNKTYTVAPTITITGGGATTAATATAVLSGGASGTVSSILITSSGLGYSSAPTLTFSGGTGTGTTAPTAVGNATRFSISAINVNNAGFGYGSVAPTVTFAAPTSGSTATATASLSSGTVTGFTITQAGNGYSSVPAVTIAAPTNTIDIAADTNYWIKPNGTLANSILVGGSPTATISNPAVLMGDTYFTMAYRKIGDTTWSNWMPPKLVEGWIKRVLAKITPFNQRMTDLYNNEINTDVSLLTQAGKRWEGDIALNLDNINDVGLIEIYETVLNRGKNFTIGSNIDFTSSNSALILAAGYLNDLYTILGNEAYADAANPTISIDDQTTVTEVNTSRFSFEGQVTSSLEEELALLKGRDDRVNPGVVTAPAYNRLWWNYTRGINSGEVLYSTNYNIKEKVGSNTADGVVDAADAQRMFPQGHGDAYGHYLTALKGYYKLLEHPYFTWTTASEDVSMLGQSIQIDYKDERKFAAAAANVAMSAKQIVSLVHRQNYKDDPTSGWSQFRDGRVNAITGVSRNQGLDEWVSRSAQGSFLNWAAGNALLPDKDNNPNHSGVQIIDRTTVPELDQLVSAASDFQNTIDNANAHLNPLGLSPGAIAFDISPAQLQAGNSHFEQIYDRALRATLNAKGAFNQAAKMTRLLRNQENQISDANTAIVDQEGAFVGQLIDIFGTPYGGDIGVGKTYAQDYDGPDIQNWFVVDRPTDLVDTGSAVTMSIHVPTQIASFTGDSIADITKDGRTPEKSVLKTVTVRPNQFLQWSSDWGGSSLGQRASTGRLQQALLDTYQAQLSFLECNQNVQVLYTRFKREYQLYDDLLKSHIGIYATRGVAMATTSALLAAQSALSAANDAVEEAEIATTATAEAVAEAVPDTVGLANSAGAPAKGSIKLSAAVIGKVLRLGGLLFQKSADALNAPINATTMSMDAIIEGISFSYEEKQQLYEFEQLYRELLAARFEAAQLATDFQRANEALRNVLVEGQNVLTDRESFRQRAAASITGYRTKDLTFRTFRNEALEQYRTLFDLAGRYTYLAAKSYDYETGLLGTTAGKAVIANVVASRALGDLTDNVPQATVSTLGDAGLAGTMAQLNSDFSVAKGRLGINNPDPYGTLFSLRGELFRILNDDTITSDDDAWKQTMQQYIVPNVMADPDVAKYCNNLKKPDGSAVPGIVLPFRSTIQHGQNYFGLPLAANDHAYTPSSYATKISSVGIVVKGYVGMDPYSFGSPGATSTPSNTTNSLSATPYVYLIPCGSDCMLAPPLGDTNTLRTWTVHDQALPLPYNLGASAFNTTQFFDANGTLSEQPWILRKHQAFRPVSDAAFFYSSIPAEFTNTRLVGRSVWNGQWKIVIPAYTLLNDEQEGLNRFVASVKDIQLFLRTYSNSGN
ncbi:MAG: hypothetical protein QE267_06180 [Akkermansiaceae bacterium]|nr:hypothetical protein [Akkermansiaceae bacterium]